MQVRQLLILIATLAFGQCSNLGILDKLENPGGVSNSSSGGEKFTTNNYIFVSSWVTAGDMSATPYTECNGDTGANRADCACSRAAGANGLRKSSTHVFRAWLSTSSSDAKCRVQALANGCMTNIPATWFNTAGQAIVNNYNGFEAPPLLAAIRYTESGADVGPDLVWTGSTSTATYFGTGADCTNWTSPAPANGVAGSRVDNTANWINNGASTACNTAQRIYCVASP